VQDFRFTDLEFSWAAAVASSSVLWAWDLIFGQGGGTRLHTSRSTTGRLCVFWFWFCGTGSIHSRTGRV